jgi:hypothetical protein
MSSLLNLIDHIIEIRSHGRPMGTAATTTPRLLMVLIAGAYWCGVPCRGGLAVPGLLGETWFVGPTRHGRFSGGNLWIGKPITVRSVGLRDWSYRVNLSSPDCYRVRSGLLAAVRSPLADHDAATLCFTSVEQPGCCHGVRGSVVTGIPT